MNEKAYTELIEENIEWLHELTGNTREGVLEKGHIITVLKWSIKQLYPDKDKI